MIVSYNINDFFLNSDHQWYLEDVYCSSLFKECLQKLPTLKTYVKRLSLMKIADPLLCRDGTLLSENKLFQMKYVDFNIDISFTGFLLFFT